jgi:hypothetical protein
VRAFIAARIAKKRTVAHLIPTPFPWEQGENLAVVFFAIQSSFVGLKLAMEEAAVQVPLGGKNVNRLLALGVPVLVCVALIATPAVSLQAQSGPVLVVSLSGVDEILGDVSYLMEVAGSGGLGQMATMMASQYVRGLDRTQPFGVVVSSDNGQLKPLGVIPVKDLPRFLDGISAQLGELKDAGNGVMELGTPVPLYVKEQSGWAFVGQSVEAFGDLPANPVSLLGGLNEKYDIAVRAVIKNVPQQYKDLAVNQMKSGIQQQLDSAANEADPEQRKLQEQLVEAQLQQWDTLSKELDEITFGWLIDRTAQQTYIDVTTTALPNTQTAGQLAAFRDMKSDFAGFAMDDAAASLQVVGAMTEADINQAIAMLGPFRDSAKMEIDDDADLPNKEAKEAAKSLVDKLFAIVEDTVRGGVVDGGASLLLKGRTMTFLSGIRIADGKKFEDSIKELARMAEQEPDFPGIRFNADSQGKVRFHTMRVPVPEGEDARDVFGENLDVVVGIAQQAAYVGFGDSCVDGLKRAIQASASASGPVSPMKLNVALGQILRFATNFEDNPMVAALADSLEQNKGRDNILVSGSAVENGVTYRIEVQDGVLKSVGQVTQAANAQ